MADRKSTRLNSSHLVISYAVFCLKKKNRIALLLVVLPNSVSQIAFALLTVSVAADRFTCGSNQTQQRRKLPNHAIFFFFNDTATTEIYTLSLHDALPICHGTISAASTDAPKCSYCV